jgi:hypothetical protein
LDGGIDLDDVGLSRNGSHGRSDNSFIIDTFGAVTAAGWQHGSGLATKRDKKKQCNNDEDGLLAKLFHAGNKSF